jgi:A/G-specific adenine glycosylase
MKPPAAKRSNAWARDFQKKLLAWYDAHARDLPWRKSPDPYRVWVSEIMLQQTRVAAVIEHYHEFLKRFPTVQRLAAAREASVLAAWSGLGYYRRARMLHAAAKVVAREKGNFPNTSEGWRELPGIGRYTAAAIASIAFGEAVAVVDGNVERVVQRMAGKAVTGEKVWEMAGGLLDHERPGDFNQAMMELGATVCTPRVPACLTCPVVELCKTRGELRALEKQAKQRKLEIHYALHRRNGSVFLVQRPKDARVMAGMWELPEILAPPDRMQPDIIVKHSITVTDYKVNVWPMSAPPDAGGEWCAIDRLPRVALTGLARKVLRRGGIFPASGKAFQSSRVTGQA